MQVEMTKIFAGMLIVAGSMICSGAAYPGTEGFEKGCEARWNRVDGTYWQLSKRSAAGELSVARVLYPTVKVSGRPAQLMAVTPFPVSEAFDMAVRAGMTCDDGTPVAAR